MKLGKLIFLYCVFSLGIRFVSAAIVINEAMSLNNLTIRDEDNGYPDWIEIYNSGQLPAGLEGYSLSDDLSDLRKWVFPALQIRGGEFIIVFASDKNKADLPGQLHTNFKIKSEGETVFLTGPDGAIVDQVKIDFLAADVSFGRKPDGSGAWLYFADATPGKSNSTAGYSGFAPAPQVSISGGFYSSAVQLRLSTSQPNAEIRYSLNGGEPTKESNLYSSDILINNTTIVRARVFAPGLMPGSTATHTFFINEEMHLPVVSISTHPDNLFDDDIGIYVEGNGTAIGGYPTNPIGPPANFWEDWERPVHIEFFETDGRNGFGIDAGIKMAGKTTRLLPQKSFAVHARSEYSYKEIDYPLFPGLRVRTFKSIMLRNAGSDNTVNEGGVHFRDGLMATIVRDLDIDAQAYRPCVVYLNGEYWGIYSIRERLNEDYLASHHGADPNNVDILDDYHQLYPWVIEGDADHYNALIDYLKSHDLRNDAFAAYVNTQMNVANFLDYMAAQIYFANHDGPGHNSKFWRPREPGGRYRWLLYDTDHSFGMRLFIPNFHYEPEAYKDNTIAYYREPNGPSWPNPPESTFMFRKILENRNFRNDFINHLADFLNTAFQPEIVLQKIDDIEKRLEPEMPRHLERWGGRMSTWQENVDVVKIFPEERPFFLRRHIQNEFNLPGQAEIALNVLPAASGRIRINTRTVDAFPWMGIYFQQVPVTLTAVPNIGHRLEKWEGANASGTEIVLNPAAKNSISVHFARDSNIKESIVINEINYHSHPEKDADDWIEIFNPLDAAVDLSGWLLKDQDNAHQFEFPENTLISAKDYLVVCKNTASFLTIFPAVKQTVGDLSFGLQNTGDRLYLYNRAGTLIDAVAYGNQHPWPWQPDGTGATLSLKNPNFDNTLAENWEASTGFGTPASANKLISNVDDQNRAEQFMLLQNYPNPFNQMTTLECRIPRDTLVTLTIYDLLGRQIALLIDEQLAMGSYKFIWSGKLENGADVPTGLYFVRLKMDKEQIIRKMMLIR